MLRFNNMNWKYIPVDSGDSIYLISETGLVYNMDSMRLLKPQKMKPSGYLYVKLKDGTTRKNFYIHRLVAECFIPNPKGYETVNHIDENKTNNNVKNLEWMTRADNVRYSIKGVPKSYFKNRRENASRHL